MPDQPLDDVTRPRPGQPPVADNRAAPTGGRGAPQPPSSTDGPFLRQGRTGLVSSDTSADEDVPPPPGTEAADEVTDEVPPAPDDEPEEDEETEEVPPPPGVRTDSEEDEETITTGEETAWVPPSAAEVARRVTVAVDGNRTPVTDARGVPAFGAPAGPLLADRAPGTIDPSTLDDGVHLQDPGPTRREKLGKPPKPGVAD